ncbi:hypothetical protein BOTBODRAFT_64107 [Botryobasidium botryosum FD-172 SS1]|uniref:PPP4R2-domain-containing protein n=1 Tax=Botryobasidium botryosum (strain FD-172 SS1) TaxID=930990 RepID=A0A067MPJ9_BOTB1|nr:hypothetical protein BOTBODRAFT_64107 [Botryobasidium botryosum FD-172 SS1]
MATEADSAPLNGDIALRPGFEWKPEYDDCMQRAADANMPILEWHALRDALKFKIHSNVSQYLIEPPPGPSTPTRSVVPASLVSESPLSMTTASAFQPAPTPSGSQMLIIPPFPPRTFVSEDSCKTQNSRMEPSEARETEAKVLALMDEFDEDFPFTIQRVCELAIRPRTHYKSVGKYLRALERTLLVTSGWDQYEFDTYALDDPRINPGAATSSDALRHATTPLFSPIPFLSKGEAPPSPLSLDTLDTVRPALVGVGGDDTGTVGDASEMVQPPPLNLGLGLVDEMDNLAEGANHMAEYPTAISSTTTLPDLAPGTTGAGVGAAVTPGGALGLSLTERFTRSRTPEPSPARVAEGVEKEKQEGADLDVSASTSAGAAESVKAEERNADDMVLDEPMVGSTSANDKINGS